MSESRVFNFAAGPACLPLSVLEKAQRELTNYNGTGMSVMELSHRSAAFQEIIDKAEADLRSLMNIGDEYAVLFLQGGASLQFAMVPANLMTNSKKACFVNTGAWSKKAIKEAKNYGESIVVASSEDKTFTYIPELTADMFDQTADYAHITSNNTIYGTRYTSLPPVGALPLVADMSSNILSEVIDVNDYGLIYAGAQKNIGPSGVTIVIIRKDLIGKKEGLPTMLDYKTHAEKGSMFNTPPTFAIYMAGLVFEQLLADGGVPAAQARNEEKAAYLYDFIDNSKLFKGTVVPKDRSIMNVPFVTGDPDKDAAFVKQAAAAGLTNLKGHRSVGGMRASIYNAMTLEGVKALVEFMKKFELEN